MLFFTIAEKLGYFCEIIFSQIMLKTAWSCHTASVHLWYGSNQRILTIFPFALVFLSMFAIVYYIWSSLLLVTIFDMGSLEQTWSTIANFHFCISLFVNVRYSQLHLMFVVASDHLWYGFTSANVVDSFVNFAIVKIRKNELLRKHISNEKQNWDSRKNWQILANNVPLCNGSSSSF